MNIVEQQEQLTTFANAITNKIRKKCLYIVNTRVA